MCRRGRIIAPVAGQNYLYLTIIIDVFAPKGIGTSLRLFMEPPVIQFNVPHRDKRLF